MLILTRQDALKSGLRRFYTGRPCKRGHDSERFVTTGNCVRCNAERSKLFASTAKKSYVARSQGHFVYPCHADDAAALLAYAQALDLARGRTPHVPAVSAPVGEVTPEQIRQMRAHAFGKAVELQEAGEPPKIDSSMAWMRDTVAPRPKTS